MNVLESVEHGSSTSLKALSIDKTKGQVSPLIMFKNIVFLEAQDIAFELIDTIVILSLGHLLSRTFFLEL